MVAGGVLLICVFVWFGIVQVAWIPRRIGLPLARAILVVTATLMASILVLMIVGAAAVITAQRWS